MELIIDSREKKIINYLSTEIKIPFKTQNLHIGDIQFINTTTKNPILIIERKTLNDLWSSIKDKRYREQKMRLKKYPNIIYLFEGQLYYSKIPKNTYYGTCINLLIRDNIKIYQTRNVEETCIFLSKLYTKVQEHIHILDKGNECSLNTDTSCYAEVIHTEKKKNMTPKNCFLAQLSQIPMISTHIAKNICQKYPTMLSLCQAYKNIEDMNEDNKEKRKEIMLSNLPKIGKMRSKKIYEYLCKS